jgi:hypothetical protein
MTNIITGVNFGDSIVTKKSLFAVLISESDRIEEPPVEFFDRGNIISEIPGVSRLSYEEKALAYLRYDLFIESCQTNLN